MPIAMPCKSGSALDSLPRHTNAKRSSTALSRLQQRKQQSSHPAAEFGRLSSNASTEAGGGSPFARKSSSTRPAKFGGKKAYHGVASSDLPLASSDLYADQLGPMRFRDRGAFSDGERGTFSDDEPQVGDDEEEEDGRDTIGSIRAINLPIRARSTSPTKANRKPMRTLNGDSGPSSPVASPSPRRTPAMPARKRVIDKATIGNPTNFQHTGHIGASSYGALSRGGDAADQLRQQLSEVAAALKLDDDFSCPPLPRSTPAVEEGSESTLASLTIPERGSGEEVMKEVSAGVPAPVQPAGVPASVQPAVVPIQASPTKPVTGLTRSPSKRKPVPAPRNLAALYSEFQKDVPLEGEEEAAPLSASATLAPSAAIEQKEQAQRTTYGEMRHEDVDLKPLPTIRAANGKRLVQGPGGDYITDTANGRWNVALGEITKALKAEGDEGDDAEDDEDIEAGLRRADEVLGRLNAL